MQSLAAQPTQHNHWQGFAGSSIGKAHIDANLPNQDAYQLVQTPDYDIAVVCDGAGSARQSQRGAQFFANKVATVLQDIAEQWLTDYHANQVTHNANMACDAPANETKNDTKLALQQAVSTELNNLRDKLAHDLAAGDSLSDYHTTLSAVILLKPIDQALLIQVGDSPIITSQFVLDKTLNSIDYFTNISLLADSQGEYVNETHFITQADWQDWLQFEWRNLSQIDLIALMSDGCGDLVVQGATRPLTIYRPFFANLVFNLGYTPDVAQANAIISETLANEATYRLTGDDKTLVILVKHSQAYQGAEPIIEPSDKIDEPATAADLTSVWQKNTTPVNPSNLGKINNQNRVNEGANQPQPMQQAALESQTVNTLPQPTSLSQTAKHRRNVTLLTSLAMLAGVGLLAWINQSTLQQYWASKHNISNGNIAASEVSASTPVSTRQAGAVPPLNAYSLATPYTIENKRSDNSNFITQTVIIAIATDSQGQALYQVPAINRAKLPKMTTLITPISQTGQRVANDRITTQLNCQPVDTQALARLPEQGVAIMPGYQYQRCQLQLLSPHTANDISGYQLAQGLAPFVRVDPIKAASNNVNQPATTASSSPASVSTKIQLYYLPMTATANEQNAEKAPINQANQPLATTPMPANRGAIQPHTPNTASVAKAVRHSHP